MTLSRDQIKDIFLKHGFTVKEGQTDLKEYVYAAAETLLKAAQDAQPMDAGEQKFIVEHPEGLILLATHHDLQESHADSVGFHTSGAYHKTKRLLRKQEARKIVLEDPGLWPSRVWRDLAIPGGSSN